MDKPTVYVETTVLSYLTGRPSRDLLIAGRQSATRLWWSWCRRDFDLVTSRLTIEEAAVGDVRRARRRVTLASSLRQLHVTPEADRLAAFLTTHGPLPPKAAADALHYAVAVVHRVDFLASWNLRHLANPVLQDRLEKACLTAGHDPVRICTPDQFSRSEDDE